MMTVSIIEPGRPKEFEGAAGLRSFGLYFQAFPISKPFPFPSLSRFQAFPQLTNICSCFVHYGALA
jgi:hypothetical protein